MEPTTTTSRETTSALLFPAQLATTHGHRDQDRIEEDMAEAVHLGDGVLRAGIGQGRSRSLSLLVGSKILLIVRERWWWLSSRRWINNDNGAISV